MAGSRNKLEFQLPSEFLTDEDILMDNSFRAAGGRFRFPTAHGGSVLSSPVESVTGSTETESDEEYYTLLSELTRTDAQTLTSAFPTLDIMLQSKLSGVGSWSGRSSVSSKGSPNGPSHFASSPTTPLDSNIDRWDLIYKAAGLVDGAGVSPSVINPNFFERQRPFPMHTPPPKSSTQPFIHPNDLVRIEELFVQQGRGMQSRQVRYTPNGCNLDQSNTGRFGSSGDLAALHGGAWHIGQFGIKNLPQLGTVGASGGGLVSGGGYGAMAHGSGVGGTMKSQRVGTGVFLPRKYGDNNSTSNTVNLHKKSGYSSPYSTKKDLNLVNSNKNSTNTIKYAEFKTQNPHRDSTADYDALLAERAYMLTLQKTKIFPEVAINHELSLPQEWTY